MCVSSPREAFFLHPMMRTSMNRFTVHRSPSLINCEPRIRVFSFPLAGACPLFETSSNASHKSERRCRVFSREHGGTRALEQAEPGDLHSIGNLNLLISQGGTRLRFPPRAYRLHDNAVSLFICHSIRADLPATE